MKVLLDIQVSKADFVMELLKNLPFVKAKQITEAKARVIDDLRIAVEEMKLIKAGKLKATSAEDFLDEL
jgi:predicted DNA-binding protein